jgi:hypothetical protein
MLHAPAAPQWTIAKQKKPAKVSAAWLEVKRSDLLPIRVRIHGSVDQISAPVLLASFDHGGQE